MMSTFVSYYTFLEEYYMGKLVLCAFTGPDDLSLVLSLICFVTAYYGSMELWGRDMSEITGVKDMVLGQFAIYGLFLANVVTTIHSFATNLYAGRNSATFQKRFKLHTFIIHVSYMVVLPTVYFSYTMLTGSTILAHAPKLTTLAYGGEFV